ncbi:hypothetical protein J3E72DRAFT_269408 [Bipolaris maydis]|nr:hypothetical protein J3E72DRAFT_269408 [Bipolaris maydis]
MSSLYVVAVANVGGGSSAFTDDGTVPKTIFPASQLSKPVRCPAAIRETKGRAEIAMLWYWKRSALAFYILVFFAIFRRLKTYEKANWAAEIEKNGFAYHSAEDIRKALSGGVRADPRESLLRISHEALGGPTLALLEDDSFGTLDLLTTWVPHHMANRFGKRGACSSLPEEKHTLRLVEPENEATHQ